MCFDIETSTMFVNEYGEKHSFIDMGDDNVEYYKKCKKYSLCYVWQFSIDDNVYMGRTLEDFKQFLEILSAIVPYRKIIYVHNFAYEFQFLLNIIKYERVFARTPRHPMTAQFEDYTFRCSYFLTRMSLDNWSKSKNLPIKKLTGSIDYDLLRTPNTKLEQIDIDYSKNDVLAMYYGLLEYREKYGHVVEIPLTQTGEVRNEVREVMQEGDTFRYRKKCLDLIPSTVEEYKELVSLLKGGDTHANQMYSGRIIRNMRAFDISSSYPTRMTLDKFPFTKFISNKPLNKYFNNSDYSYIIHFKCESLRSIRFNTFLSVSKTIKIRGQKLDNGRVIKCDYVECKMINVDFEIFLQCYEMKDLEIIEFKTAKNEYLHPALVLYILEMYGRKTSLKDLEGYESLYMQGKQFINSLYGVMVTREITDDIIWNCYEGWGKELLTDESFIRKINSQKKKMSSVIGTFAQGIFVPAYGRRELWKSILHYDKETVYFDTDSNKLIETDFSFFENYNREIELQENRRAKELGISPDLFNPADKNGVRHRLGIFDYEGKYERFVTLGAKKYCDEKYDKHGKLQLEMTVSGISKKCVDTLGKIENFKDGFSFNVETSKKMTLEYQDDMDSIIWKEGEYDEFKSDYRYGISNIKTTFTLGMTPEYLALLAENSRENEVTGIFEQKTEFL